MFILVAFLCLFATVSVTPSWVSPNFTGRISGGTDTSISKHPYLVSLQDGGSHICSGSIISANYVLTAAQCTGRSGLTIRAGSNYNGIGGTVYNVARVVRHAQYDSWSIDYDYAIIQILGSFNLSSIALPEQDENVAVGTRAVVVGWSSTGGGRMQEAEVRILNHTDCGSISPRMICAGDVSRGPCKGDEGGPLVAGGKLVGLVSSTGTCGRPTSFSAYARVAAVRNWITQNSGV